MAAPYREYHYIHVILDGKDYGIRYWTNVPRTGEFIMLKARDGSHFTAKVTQVTWGVAVDDAEQKWPDINLHCKRTSVKPEGQ